MSKTEIKKKIKFIKKEYTENGIKRLGLLQLLLISFLMVILQNNCYAAETPAILQKLFNYADIYYNIDNTNNTDIISNDLKSALSHIHYNKNTYKTYYEQFANEEHYNDLSTCLLSVRDNGIIYISFGYSPNLENYNNYAEKYFNGSITIPLYRFNFQERLRINYNTRTNIFELVEYSKEAANVPIQAISNNTYSYNLWNRAVVIYNDNNYYCSNPNFNGNANYFITNSNSRINGMADFGFFNLDYSSLNNEQDFINFGEVYIGYNFTQSNIKCYLVDYDNSEILDNDVQLNSAGNLYNGRIIYQPILEDFSGLNDSTNYELMISSDNSMLKPFYSEKFNINIGSPGGNIPGGTIIVSGDYNGVGSGEGFNKAINDINNNLAVIGGKIDDNNNFWKKTFNSLFTIESGESEEMVKNFVNEIDIGTSGDEQVISGIINNLKGQADDFVISWDNIYIPNLYNNERTLLISGDSINFSELARENEGLREAKTWLNTIVSMTMSIMLFMNYKTTIMKLLGTSNEFIDPDEIYYETQAVINDDTLNPSSYPIPYINSAGFYRKYYEWYGKGGYKK